MSISNPSAMSLSHQILVMALIAITQPSLSLPITSKPLETNPDHLTRDTMFAAIYQTDGHEARKIPKSIFIAPELSYSTCSPGYSLNHTDNRCYKDVIQINSSSFVFDAAFNSFSTPTDKQQNGGSTYTGSYEYDYDDDSSSSNSAVYNVPLTLGFGSDLTPAASTSTTGSKLTDTLQSSPFLNSGVVIPTNSQTRRTIDNLPTTQSMGQSSTTAKPVGTTETDVARDSIVAEYITPIETTTLPMDSTTTVQKASDRTTTEISLPATTEDFFLNTIPTTTNDEHDQHVNEALNNQNRLAIAQLEEQIKQVQNIAESNTLLQDEELTKELKEESLFRDETVTETSTVLPSTTFEPTEDPTTEIVILSTQPDAETTIPIKPVTSTKPTKATSQATEDRVFVVTPESSTSPTIDSVIAATELLNKESGIESEAIIRQRQTVNKHELNEDARQSIDQHNRFIYAHLPTGTTERPVLPTTTHSPRTVSPTRESLRDRLNRFHRLSEENRKGLKVNHHIQPSSDIFSNRRYGSSASNVRFPDTRPHPGSHQRITDRSKPLFAWLPAGWSFDQTGGHPNIKAKPGISFWNDMPLIRDPALSGIESTDRAARANSRSPTEHLFRQEEEEEEDESEHLMARQSMLTPDVHKMVLATRNARYENR